MNQQQPPTHEHSAVYAALRAEKHFEDDTYMADYIASEHPSNPSIFDPDGSRRADSAKGRAWAADIAQAHGVEGVDSIYRSLHPNSRFHLPVDEEEQAMDAIFTQQLEGKGEGFKLGATLFCERSGVLS